MGVGAASTSVRGPKSQEGTCESLTGSIVVATDIFILIFSSFFGVMFNFFSLFVKIIMYDSLRFLNFGGPGWLNELGSWII